MAATGIHIRVADDVCFLLCKILPYKTTTNLTLLTINYYQFTKTNLPFTIDVAKIAVFDKTDYQIRIFKFSVCMQLQLF